MVPRMPRDLSVAIALMVYGFGFTVDVFSDDRLSLPFAAVESGQMTMGEDDQGGYDEKPSHTVRISRSFEITSRVITNADTSPNGEGFVLSVVWKENETCMDDASPC